MSHTARDRRSSAALRKADKFAAENDVGRRVQAKQAILHELNAQLKSRSERLKSEYVAAVSTEPGSSSRNGLSPHRFRFTFSALREKFTTQQNEWC